MREYLHEAAGFLAGYIWTALILSLGAHETVQESVCSIESFTAGIVEIEACNGYLTVLQQVVTGDIIFQVTGVLTGVLLAFGIHVLKDQ
jgi:biotin transporter BioY